VNWADVLQEERSSLSDQAVIQRFDEATVRLDACLAECPEPVTGTWSRRCTNLAWERFLLSHFLTGVFVHEMGHLRAQLTENDPTRFPQYQVYHKGTLPSGWVDAMRTYISTPDMAKHPYPEFDAIDDLPHPGDTTSCQGNLVRNRGVS
jgi:hypothetical protein